MFVPWQREAAMNKDEWKAFFGWLDSASEAQLVEMKSNLCRTYEVVTESGVKGDIRRMRRLVDEEVLARQNLASLTKSRSRKG